MKPINFRAEIGGDGECFCFIVDGDTFKKVMGKKEYDDEVKYHLSRQKEMLDINFELEFKIYPGRLLEFLGKSIVDIDITENEITIS